MTFDKKSFRVTERVQDLADAQAEFGAAMALALQPARSLTKAGLVRVLKAIALVPIVEPEMSKMQDVELEVFKRILVLMDRKQSLMEAMIRDMEGADVEAGPADGETV